LFKFLKMLKKHPYIEYKFFAEAWLYLAISRFLIVLRPFRKLLPYLGKPIKEEEATKEANHNKAPAYLLQLIQISILRAGKRSPWRTLCYEQALTARMMLRKRKYKSVIYFGLLKNADNANKNLRAHAWLICSGISVTGGKNNDNYSIVGRFLI
jgi:hypothetical protein